MVNSMILEIWSPNPSMWQTPAKRCDKQVDWVLLPCSVGESHIYSVPVPCLVDVDWEVLHQPIWLQDPFPYHIHATIATMRTPFDTTAQLRQQKLLTLEDFEFRNHAGWKGACMIIPVRDLQWKFRTCIFCLIVSGAPTVTDLHWNRNILVSATFGSLDEWFQNFQTKFQDIVRFGLRHPGILNHNFRFQGKEWILQLRGKTFAEQEATIPASCISGCIAWSTEANWNWWLCQLLARESPEWIWVD